MTPAECLRKAAERIERDGWIQGSLGLGWGEPCCTIAAILQEATSVDAAKGAEHAMIDYVGVNGVAFWNDQPERTKEQVLRTLRYVADRLDHPDRDRGEGEAG